MTTNIQDNNSQKTYYYVVQLGSCEVKRCETLKETLSYCEELVGEDSDNVFSNTKFNSNGVLELDEYEIVIFKGKTLKAKHSVSIEE
jgi:hypothetical protein